MADIESLISESAAALASGRRDSAREKLKAALKLAPDHLDGHFLLGTLLAEDGDLKRALRHLRRAAEIAPRSARVWNNLATAQRLAKDREAALDCYVRALGAEPDMAEAGANLRALLEGFGPFGIGAAPGRLAAAWAALGQFHFLRGERDAALAAYRRAQSFAPDHGHIAFQVAALSGRPEPRPAPGDVAKMFDGYADIFDSHLALGLDYRVPERIADAIAEIAGPERRFPRALDLGCGTGLSGLAIRGAAAHLSGIDLSPKMLARARERGVFDALHEDDIFAFLAAPGDKFDLFVAADLLIYVGRIDELLTAVAARAQPGALFLFSVESHAGPEDWVVQATGRYAHRAEYVRRAAGAAGYEIRLERDVPLRKEGTEYRPGILYGLSL